MEAVTLIAITVQILTGIITVAGLIYYINKRIKEKREEDFEKRDN